MKKLFILILIILLGAGIWYGYHKKTAPEPIKIAPVATQPDASNATFTFDGEAITLKKGLATTSVTPDGDVTQETMMSKDVAYGDVNTDGKPDTAVILIQSGSGSGIFVYVAAYVSGLVQYKGSNTVFLGDRVSPQSITIDKSGVITVVYLDRKPDEPFAEEPTVSTTKRFVYTGGELKEK